MGDIIRARDIAHSILNNVKRVIVGKDEAIEMGVLALMCHGHALIEDVPGVGKTMLARSIARSVGCSFKRIQFTPDMLPTDVTGVSIYNQKVGDFEFRPGPIMAQVVLADEINRATPKTQSALLECMEERQVTVDGVTYAMARPFMVLATQNPIEYEGTFPLPEAQLDRFLLRITLGYPTAAEEVTIINSQQLSHPIEKLEAVANPADITVLQEAVKEIYVDDLIKEYIVSLIEASRKHPEAALGGSPRASIGLFRCAQALALMKGREYALPDDVKTLVASVLAHRVIVSPSARMRGIDGRKIVKDLAEQVPVPGAQVRGWLRK